MSPRGVEPQYHSGRNVESMKDPYKILNVTRDAEQEVVAAAYKALARKYHPDVSELDAQRMKEINWAYDLLRDARRRAQWDYQRTNTQTSTRSKDPAPHEKSHAGSNRPRSGNGFRTSLRRWLATGVWILLFVWIASVFGDAESSQSQASPSYTPLGSITKQRTNVAPTDSGRFGTAFAAAANAQRTMVAASTEEQFILKNECISHSDVLTNHLGESLCVYGTVVLDIWNEECGSACYQGDIHYSSLYTVIFTGNQSMIYSDDFRFSSTDRITVYNYRLAYEDIVKKSVSWQDLLAPGHCIAAIGEIAYFKDFPFLTIQLSDEETTLYWLSPSACEK